MKYNYGVHPSFPPPPPQVSDSSSRHAVDVGSIPAGTLIKTHYSACMPVSKDGDDATLEKVRVQAERRYREGRC